MKTKKMTMIDVKNNQFYQLPKFLYLDNDYRGLSNDSKVLYSLYLDRTSLSMKNDFIDNCGHIYIKFKNTKAMELLHICTEKLAKLKKELKNYGLIHELRKGFKQSNWIYVLICNSTKVDINEFEDYDAPVELKENENNLSNDEIRKSNFMKFENRTSRDSKIELHEVRKSNAIYTDLNKTDLNKTNMVDFFEKIWNLYPLKRGKGSIKNKKKKELYLLGFEKIQLAIERYTKDYELRKLDFQQLSLKNGSTFFNSGYHDYIDDNFEYYKPNKKTNKSIQSTNYEQRKYDEEFFNNLYDNEV